MPQQFKNNARALLAAGITNTATSLTVEAPKADLFPVANTGTASVPATTDWFKAVLEDSSGNIEIIYVRTRASGSALLSNVLRGQEGTTARAYAAGDVVGLRMTAADVQGAVGMSSANTTFTGTNTFTPQQVFSGGVKLGTDWTVTQSGTDLIWAYQGVNKMKLSSGGTLTLTGTVIINGAP